MCEKKIIKFEVITYRDPHGNPTCARDFRDGRVCKFYRTQRFGCNEVCLFSPTHGSYSQIIERRMINGQTGSLIPGDWCPIWKEEINEK